MTLNKHKQYNDYYFVVSLYMSAPAVKPSKIKKPVKFKNSLKQFSKENDAVNSIVDSVNYNLPDYQLLGKVDLELIDYVCTEIEILVKNNGVSKKKIDKKQLCIKVFKRLFPSISSEDIKIIDNQIEYLCNNGLIKLQPVLKRIGSSLYDCLKKKFTL